jgi:hypothetical protein
MQPFAICARDFTSVDWTVVQCSELQLQSVSVEPAAKYRQRFVVTDEAPNVRNACRADVSPMVTVAEISELSICKLIARAGLAARVDARRLGPVRRRFTFASGECTGPRQG